MPGSVLLIAGAGASRNLGFVDRPLLLMSEWAPDLVRRISDKCSWLADAIGLQAGLSGEQFEACLGRFLAWQRSLPVTADLQVLGEENALGQVGISSIFRRALSKVADTFDSHSI